MKTAFSILLSLVITGCSCFVPSKQKISVSVYPDDSKVFVNGQVFTSFPAIADVPRNRSVQIQCAKDGYYPYGKTVDTRISTTGILDIIGCAVFLIPGIGLITPGAWCLEEDTVNIVLHQVVK